MDGVALPHVYALLRKQGWTCASWTCWTRRGRVIVTFGWRGENAMGTSRRTRACTAGAHLPLTRGGRRPKSFSSLDVTLIFDETRVIQNRSGRLARGHLSQCGAGGQQSIRRARPSASAPADVLWCVPETSAADSKPRIRHAHAAQQVRELQEREREERCADQSEIEEIEWGSRSAAMFPAVYAG